MHVQLVYGVTGNLCQGKKSVHFCQQFTLIQQLKDFGGHSVLKQTKQNFFFPVQNAALGNKQHPVVLFRNSCER